MHLFTHTADEDNRHQSQSSVLQTSESPVSDSDNEEGQSSQTLEVVVEKHQLPHDSLETITPLLGKKTTAIELSLLTVSKKHTEAEEGNYVTVFP